MQWDGIRLGLASVAKQNDWPTFVFVCMIGNQMSLLSRIGQLSCGQLSVGSTNVASVTRRFKKEPNFHNSCPKSTNKYFS